MYALEHYGHILTLLAARGFGPLSRCQPPRRTSSAGWASTTASTWTTSASSSVGTEQSAISYQP